METAPVFDYKQEFWKLFKECEIFFLYYEELLNHLPREDLAKALEEIIHDLKRIEENPQAKKVNLFARIGIRDRISRAEIYLKQIKEGKEKLEIKSNQ